jgi:hypothetical protein
MQTRNRIVTFLAVLGTIFAFDRASFAGDLKMFIWATCNPQAQVTGSVKRTVIQNMQMVDQPCWSGPMDLKLGWYSMGYGSLYPYYIRHEMLIEQPAEGAAPFAQNGMYSGTAVWESPLGGHNQSQIEWIWVTPVNP